VTEPPEQPAPERIAVHWSPEARADLRSIDREPAMQILYWWIATSPAAPAMSKS
jgi:hypothetical protein